MKNYFAVAELGDDGVWWISFPDRDGIAAAADAAIQITAQAQDALASVAMHGGRLPPAIEDGAAPPADLSCYGQYAIVVVIPFAPAAVAKAA